MNFRKTLLALSVLGAAGMSGCGGSSHDHPVLTSASGEAIDGYLQNARVCFDTTGDKSCSDEASITTTDINGEYSISGIGVGSSVILVESVAATTESDTKGTTGPAAGLFTLSALQGSTVVSPFSTMIQVGVEHSVYSSVAVAEAAILASLGLSAGTDIKSYDFIEAGNTNVIAIAETVTDVIANNVVQVGVIAGTNYGSETVLETAILELIDTDAGDAASDFATLATAVAAVVAANPTANASTIVADAAVTAAVTASNVDPATDAADVSTSLDTTSTSNAAENDTGGETDTGTGGTGGTGAT